MTFPLCRELGLMHVEGKASIRKRKVLENFSLDEIISNAAIRSTVALKLGNIEIERMIEAKYYEDLKE
jgi:hypothetical protein